MQEALKVILEIQELDMKMLRLMRVKKERQKELNHLRAIIDDFKRQVSEKDEAVFEIKKSIRIMETQVAEGALRIERLEAKQNAVKKVEEFNALSHEITSAERERTNFEQQLSDLTDQLSQEEDSLKQLNESLASTENNSRALEEEIKESIRLINEEGQILFKERESEKVKAPEEMLRIYERLLHNKKDRVLVPIENRTCGGCHIVLTAQHENLVRKGERLVFCEHCSRMHYWQESEVADGTSAAPKRRRRRTTTTS
ncbi:MAG: zinc ribbon domain-containing protein [Parachlamydiales bacterium]|nr:zinc ribbon domain-containing protein [Parachlamydiales bacterium]